MNIAILLYLNLFVDIKQLHSAIVHPNPYDIPFLAPIDATHILPTFHQLVHFVVVPIPQIH